MLAYLDALVTAVRAGDAVEIERLLAHPLARILSRDAVRESRAALHGANERAPLRLLQLRHQTAHLLGATGATPVTEPRALPPTATRARERRGASRQQIELPLSA